MDDQLKQKAKLEPLRRVLDGEASEAQLDAMFEAIVEIVAMLDDGRLETAHHPVKFLLQTVSALQGTTVDTRDGTMRYDDPSCPSIARTMEGLRDQPQAGVDPGVGQNGNIAGILVSRAAIEARQHEKGVR